MPVELQVIRANEFVRLDPREHLDFDASKQALQAIAQACRKRGLERAVLDLRSLPTPAKPLFTKTELANLVLIFRDAGFSEEERLAILYQHDIHGGIRDFAFISRLRGMHVQAFTDFEAALQWLSEDEEAHDKAEVPVPITKSPKETKKLPVGFRARNLRSGSVRPNPRKCNHH